MEFNSSAMQPQAMTLHFTLLQPFFLNGHLHLSMFKMHGHMTLLFEGSFKYFAILQGICRVFQVFLQGLKGVCMVILNLAKKDKRMVYAWF